MQYYDPQRPITPSDLPFEPPAPPPAPDPHAPVHTPPPHHPCGRNPDIPVMRPVPPVASPIEGTSLYESMAHLTHRVNECIEQWNIIQRNNYEYLRQGVAIARANDVYYDNKEVCYTQGYDTAEGCEYAIIRKAAVDHCGKPIFVNLVPAYRNGSNPGAGQPIFDASFIESANVIMTAVPANSQGWDGPAMWQGNPIPGNDYQTSSEKSYVYGFTRRGELRYFDRSVITSTTLVQQSMFNVIGGCVPILYDGKLLDGVEDMTDRQAVTAIGFNSGDGSVYFFACSAQNQPGMGIARVAKILQEYGCTVAVVTSASTNEPGVSVSEGLMYMGQLTIDPVQAVEPANLAYWVITKKPFFRNEFQKEIADLVQTTGRNAWRNYLLGVQIQDFDDRITANAKAIADEIERATNAEAELRADLEAETDRATQEEAALREQIEAETDRAKDAEQQITNALNDEISRAKQAESQIASNLNDEILRATQKEAQLQDDINRETQARIKADADLLAAIQSEIQARQNADAEIHVEINNLLEKINNILAGTADLPYLKLTGGIMTGPVTFTSTNTLTVGRGPTAPLEVATKKYVDDAIAGGTTPGTDVSKEYVDQQITNIQNQLDGKVSKDGDTMTGDLEMDGHKIVKPVLSSANGVSMDDGAGGPGRLINVADPIEDNDAVNKKSMESTIDSKIEAAVGDLESSYLKLTGGTMTGDIVMQDGSVVDFDGHGSVYADGADSVIKSEVGKVRAIGSEILLADTGNNPISIVGSTGISRGPGGMAPAILLDTAGITARSGTLNVGNGNTTGMIKSGGHTLYNSAGTMIGSIAPASDNTLNVYGVNGLSVSNKKITQLADGVADTDAVTVAQLKKAITNPFNGSYANSIGEVTGKGTNAASVKITNGTSVANLTVTAMLADTSAEDVKSTINNIIVNNGAVYVEFNYRRTSNGSGEFTILNLTINAESGICVCKDGVFLRKGSNSSDVYVGTIVHTYKISGDANPNMSDAYLMASSFNGLQLKTVSTYYYAGTAVYGIYLFPGLTIFDTIQP